MDGYIKNKFKEIKSVRKAILGKYSLTIFILLMLLGFLLAVCLTLPHPDKWKEETVVFSEIKRERLAFQRFESDVFVAADGRLFSIPNLTEVLKNVLLAGESCKIIYSTGIFTSNVEGLEMDGTVYIDVNDSIISWKKECKDVVIIACGMLAAEIIALLLIDRLWCKKEHQQIKKLKENIARREAHLSKR